MNIARALADLGLGYAFTKQANYADKAIDLLYHWCLNPATYMEPTGHNHGPVTCTNNAGDVEVMMVFSDFFFAADFIWDYPGWNAATKAGIKEWIRKMVEAKRGLLYYAGAEDMKNNWEDWRLTYEAAGAVVLEDWDLLWELFDRWKYILPFKVGPNGELVEDITREQSVHYCLFSLDPYTRVAEIARHYGVDLYNYTVDTLNLELVYDFHAYFLSDWKNRGSEWPRSTTPVTNADVGCFELAYSEWRKTPYLATVNYWGRPSEFQSTGHHPTLTNANRFQLNFSNYVKTPAINPLDGYFVGSAKVTLTCATTGAEIRYTTNGSNPTASSTKYTGPFDITSSVIIKAIGIKSGMQTSAVAIAPLTKAQVVADPVFSPAPGNYPELMYVTLTCATPGAKIYYTLYGSEPTTSSREYTKPFVISSTKTVKARAFIDGPDWRPSNIMTGEYTIGPAAVNEPGVEMVMDRGDITVTPNPMRDVVEFKIHRKDAKTPRIIIYNNTGIMVNNYVGTGRDRSLRWGGTNMAGNMVQPGVYFYSIEYNGILHSGRLIKAE
jgi:hypothetical protein